MSLTKVSFSMIKGNCANVLDFGDNTAPGVTDMAPAINAAIASSISVYIPAGTYKLNSPIIMGKHTKLVGDGYSNIGTLLVAASGVTAIRMWGDTPPAFTDQCECIVEDISLAGTSYTGIGIDLYACIDVSFKNIRVEGFNYGIYARTTIGVTFTGTTRLTGNNVGLKIPALAIGNICANLWTFESLNVRSNLKAGASIGAAGNWTIANMLGESNNVVMYLCEQIDYFRVDNLYIETSATPTVPNRLGVNQLWSVYMGLDEDGNTYSIGSSSILLENIMTWFDVTAFNFQNVNGVRAFINAGRGTIQCGTGVFNLHTNCIGGEKAGNKIIKGYGRSAYYKNFTNTRYNLIPNGNFRYPQQPAISYSTATSATIVTSALLLDGDNSNMLHIVLPAGQATTELQYEIRRGPDTNPGSFVSCTLHGLATDSKVDYVEIAILDASASVVSSGSSSIAHAGNDWQVVQVGAGIPLNELKWSLRVRIHRADTTGVSNYYIDEIISTFGNDPEINTTSPLDFIVGNSFTVVCDTLDGAVYKAAPITVEYAYYSIIATPQIASAIAPPTVGVLYGGSTATVYSDTNGAIVNCFVLPKQGITP